MTSAQERTILRNVIAVARRELADRDADSIPPRLRRVAKNSSRTLPPPFADSVLREVRDDPVFRESVRDRWDEERVDDPIGRHFLEDPETAEIEIAETSKDARLAHLEGDLDVARNTIEALEEQLSEAKRRVASQRSEQEAALIRRQKAEEASRTGLLRTIRTYEAEIRAGEHDRGLLTDRIDELEAALEIAEDRAARSAERANRRRAPIPSPRDPHLVQPPKDPVAFAAWLDTVERTQRPYREAERSDTVSDALGPVTIPSGIPPDTREAVSAVIAQQPALVVIDGYNVSGSFMHEDFSSHAARASVIAKAERLAASCGSSVVVVFDSSDVEGRVSFRSVGGVDVVFSQNRSADDEIVDIVEHIGERAVVITTDRELRERCAVHGAVSVWSDAFVEWANC